MGAQLRWNVTEADPRVLACRHEFWPFPSSDDEPRFHDLARPGLVALNNFNETP